MKLPVYKISLEWLHSLVSTTNLGYVSLRKTKIGLLKKRTLKNHAGFHLTLGIKELNIFKFQLCKPTKHGSFGLSRKTSVFTERAWNVVRSLL